jgi:hypothetical protein
MSRSSKDARNDITSFSTALAGLADPFSATVVPAGSGGRGGITDVLAPIQYLSVDTNMENDELSSQGMLLDGSPNLFGFVDVKLESKKISSSVGSPSLKYRLFCLPATEKDLNKLCLGLIGQGSKFCIKKECTTFHNGKGANVSLGSLHVMRTNDSLFVEPSAPSNMLDTQLLQTWMQERLTLEEWSERFSIIPNTTTVASNKTFDVAADFAKTARFFKSPLKTPADTLKLDTLLNNVFKVKIYKRKIDDVSDFVAKKPSVQDIINVLATTEESVEEITTCLVATNNSLETLNYKVANEIPILFSKQDTLEASVGKRVAGTIPAFEAPTLWSSMSLLSNIIVDTRNEITQIKTDVLNNISDQPVLSREIANSIVKPEIESVDQRVSDIRDRMSESITNIVQRLNRDASILFTTKMKVEQLQNNAGQSRAVGDNPIDSKALLETAVKYDADIAALKNQFLKMEAIVRSLEADNTKEAVKFCKLGFKTLKDSSAWVEANQHQDFGLVDF